MHLHANNTPTRALARSFACSNERGAQNSPECQVNSFLMLVGETTAAAMEVYRELGRAHEFLRASSPADSPGIRIELTPPPNAKYVGPDQIGVKGEYYLHFSDGWYEHDDNKMLSIGYFGHAAAQSLNDGGMFIDVKKVDLLKPSGRVLPAADPTFSSNDYKMYTKEDMLKCSASAAAELATLAGRGIVEDKAVRQHMNKFCSHGWTKGIPTLPQFEFVFAGPMHGFMNECQYTSDMIDDYAEELESALDLT